MNAQSIERAGREVGRLNLADHILSWDKKQARETIEVTRGLLPADDRYRTIPNPTARVCQKDPSHGMLQMHGSGQQVMCCAMHPTPCDYAEPVSR